VLVLNNACICDVRPELLVRWVPEFIMPQTGPDKQLQPKVGTAHHALCLPHVLASSVSFYVSRIAGPTVLTIYSTAVPLYTARFNPQQHNVRVT